MHNNKITDVGARAIGEALAENHALTSLTLSSNAVSDDGAAGLAEGLKRNKALRHLNLYFNLVGDAARGTHPPPRLRATPARRA